jgi:hypothetical protein
MALVSEGRVPDIARAIALLEKLLKASVAERLIAAKAAADDHLPDTVAWWTAWVHAQLGTRPQLAPAARGLLDLSTAVAEPKFNRRLALERFLLELG